MAEHERFLSIEFESQKTFEESIAHIYSLLYTQEDFLSFAFTQKPAIVEFCTRHACAEGYNELKKAFPRYICHIWPIAEPAQVLDAAALESKQIVPLWRPYLNTSDTLFVPRRQDLPIKVVEQLVCRAGGYAGIENAIRGFKVKFRDHLLAAAVATRFGTHTDLGAGYNLDEHMDGDTPPVQARIFYLKVTVDSTLVGSMLHFLASIANFVRVAIKAKLVDPGSEKMTFYPGFETLQASYRARFVMSSIPLLKNTDAATFEEVAPLLRMPIYASTDTEDDLTKFLHVLFPPHISDATAVALVSWLMDYAAIDTKMGPPRPQLHKCTDQDETTIQRCCSIRFLNARWRHLALQHVSLTTNLHAQVVDSNTDTKGEICQVVTQLGPVLDARPASSEDTSFGDQADLAPAVEPADRSEHRRDLPNKPHINVPTPIVREQPDELKRHATHTNSVTDVAEPIASENVEVSDFPQRLATLAGNADPSTSETTSLVDFPQPDAVDDREANDGDYVADSVSPSTDRPIKRPVAIKRPTQVQPKSQDQVLADRREQGMSTQSGFLAAEVDVETIVHKIESITGLPASGQTERKTSAENNAETSQGILLKNLRSATKPTLSPRTRTRLFQTIAHQVLQNQFKGSSHLKTVPKSASPLKTESDPASSPEPTNAPHPSTYRIEVAVENGPVTDIIPVLKALKGAKSLRKKGDISSGEGYVYFSSEENVRKGAAALKALCKVFGRGE